MAYSTNPNLPKARATAMQLLVAEQQPVSVVARKCGIHRSTVWRWKRKWNVLNQNVQFDNPNRPTRPVSLKNKLIACVWRIPTDSSRPHSSPRRLSISIVSRILELRQLLKRCAEVIWHHIATVDHISISLNSVRRTLKRHHCFDGARKKRVRPDNPRRPLPTSVGELVETDTIHYVCPQTGRRLYVYTVIDVCSRMTYAEIHPRILPGIAARVIVHARQEFGFDFHMVQADNGPEFSSYFTQVLKQHNMPVRHTRLGRPNDNAHIERFNRTIQEECLGRTIHYSSATKHLQTKINNYLEYYNYKRVHLGLQCETPASVSSMLRRS
jgi:transposase InsO family protein